MSTRAATVENNMTIYQKRKIELPYELATSLLLFWRKEKHSFENRNTHFCFLLKNRNTVSFAILFVISKIWKPPKCPSIDELMKACVYIYNGILLSHKRNEILSFVTTWMNLDGEISRRMTNTIWCRLYVESKKQNKWINITRQKQTHR